LAVIYLVEICWFVNGMNLNYFCQFLRGRIGMFKQCVRSNFPAHNPAVVVFYNQIVIGINFKLKQPKRVNKQTDFAAKKQRPLLVRAKNATSYCVLFVSSI
jgi:hypothetical protein